MKLHRGIFGRTSEGREVEIFTLESEAGFRAELITYGATLRSFRAPGRSGPPEELTLGFDTLAEYEEDGNCFGATLGRCAGGIAGGSFTLDGIAHQVSVNAGRHHLNGGVKGFQRHVWKAESFLRPDLATVLFHRISPEGEEGYPGELRISLACTLSEDGDFSLVFEAEADESTPVNPAGHSFWNLGGMGSGSVENQELRLFCPFYLPADREGIPTGEVLSVRGTALDFTRPGRIGEAVRRVGPEGFDQVFAVGPAALDPAPAALLRDHESGRTMEVLTTLPGLRFNSGHGLPEGPIAGGRSIAPLGALSLETGYFPDAVNRPHFPSPVIAPGETSRSMTVYRFRVS